MGHESRFDHQLSGRAALSRWQVHGQSWSLPYRRFAWSERRESPRGRLRRRPTHQARPNETRCFSRLWTDALPRALLWAERSLVAILGGLSSNRPKHAKRGSIDLCSWHPLATVTCCGLTTVRAGQSTAARHGGRAAAQLGVGRHPAFHEQLRTQQAHSLEGGRGDELPPGHGSSCGVGPAEIWASRGFSASRSCHCRST